MESPQFRSILGIKFFVGDATQAVNRMKEGGLLVVPAAPALKNLPHDLAYRNALLEADLVIADSAFMVLIWNYLQKDSIRRVSGLEYLTALLKHPSLHDPHESFWIMPSEDSAHVNCQWLQEQGIALSPEDMYVAPLYGKAIQDPALLERIHGRRPRHIVVAIGGGTQERLGLYLRQELDYSPSIHCVGAAIAFLSGDQVHIPVWADRMYLGWLFRCLSNPRQYLPRYWDARKLLALMVRHGSSLPGSAA
ncbi:MAG TPA: WecB/TagA/CpsF family glycosyltransferase, partial [Acidobacteriaceae bacterium]|nr:WecB/TagA/CpsF family glycosyltransferase [Acidobacteriaceae bacterium]